MRRISTSLFALVVLLSACAGDRLTIYAPPELAEGTIFIDGKLAGRFQKTQREYRWVGWAKMKEELMNAPRSETIAKLPPVVSGRHELRIEKAGYEPIVTTFNYSHDHAEVEIDDVSLKSLKATPPR